MQRAARSSSRQRGAAKPTKKHQVKRTKASSISTTSAPVATRKAAPTTTSLTTTRSTPLTTSKRNSTFFAQPCDPDSPVLTEIVDDNVLLVKWNKPKRFNAMDVEMGDRFLDIVKHLKEDNCKTIKCVIFTGMGKAYSAGGDLQFLKDRSEDEPANNIQHMLQFYSRFMSIRELPQVTIAAINGPAIGAGACITLLSDLRVMSSAATLGFTFAQLGLHPGMGCTHYLPKLTDPQVANHLLLSGEIIDAGQCKNFKIIHDVVQVDTPDDVEVNNQLTVESARILAKHYTKNYSPATYTLTRTLRSQLDVGLQSALLREAECQGLTYNSPDFKSRLDAMMNRKKK